MHKILSSAAILFMVISIGIGRYFVYPDISSLSKKNPDKTSFMKFREEQWGREGKKTRIRQRWVPLSRISPYLIEAVIIAEDDRFWSHEGFDVEAIKAAIERDIREKKIKFGGSTITQQLAKNLYLTPAKNPLRKLKEAIFTWRLERALSKRRILEIYLNVAEWGDGIFGIEAASRHYFGKSSSNLSPDEASRLAVILPNPRRYDPVNPGRYVESRSKAIFDIMVKRGIVMEIPEREPSAGGEAGENPEPLREEGGIFDNVTGKTTKTLANTTSFW